MKKLIAAFIIFCLFPVLLMHAQKAPAPWQQEWNTRFSSQRGGLLEANYGQVCDARGTPVPSVLFRTAGKGEQIYITDQGLTYVLLKKTGPDTGILPGKVKSLRIDESLAGAHIDPSNVEYLEEGSGGENQYFNPHFPNGLYHVKSYKRIRIRNIYPGINWIIETGKGEVKYSFEVSAGADPSVIRLHFSGADSLALSPDGSLLIHTRFGDIGEKAPLSVQIGQSVPTGFCKRDSSTFGFTLGKHDPHLPLLIDPTLYWSTLFGGVQEDAINALTTDAQGNVIACGYTASFNMPVVDPGAGAYYEATLNSLISVFVCKFSSNGHLLWSTFYSGTYFGYPSYDRATAVKTDAQGNIFVTGTTGTSNFPVQNGGGFFQNNLQGMTDAFLLKFNAAGVRQFATFLGGNGMETATDLVIGSNGHVVLCGNTSSGNYPTQNLSGSFFFTYGSGFISEFDNSGNLVWSTQIPGTSLTAIGLALDHANNLYFTASCFGGAILLNNGGYYQATSSYQEVYLARFNTGRAQNWGTLYGGSDSDIPTQIITDANDNLLCAGYTASGNFPHFRINSGYYMDSVLNDGSNPTKTDMFLIKFDPSCQRLWSTYYGGKFDENIKKDGGYYNLLQTNNSLIADACGNFYFGFNTFSPDIQKQNGTCNAFYDNNLSTTEDAFLTEFSSGGSLRWATFFGGMQQDFGCSLALDARSNLFVAGQTAGDTGFIFAQPDASSFEMNYNVNQNDLDGFISEFTSPPFNAGVSYANCSGGCNGSAEAFANTACPSAAFTYLWSNGAGGNTQTGLCPGNYSVIIKDTVNCNTDTSAFTMPAGGFNFFVNASPYSCTYTCDASASIVIPGTSGVSFQWVHDTTVIPINANYVPALCPGNYHVTVTVPGCGAQTQNFSIGIPPLLTATINSVWNNPANCSAACTSTAQVVLNGGEHPGHCVWSNGDTGTAADSLCPGQTYTVTAVDSSCYVTNIHVYIPFLPPMTASVGSTLGCGCNSSASVINVYHSGPGTLSYLWSNGDTTSSVSGLCPGFYTVTTTSTTCGSVVNTVNIPAPLPLHIQNIIQITYPCNGGCNGLISVILNGGTPGFNIQILTLSGVPANNGQLCDSTTYKIYVQDQCGQTDSATFLVHHNPVNGSMLIIPNTSQYTCPGMNNGVEGVHVTGGTPPYQVVISNGNTFTLNSQGQIITSGGFSPGQSYTITVTDACGAVMTTSFIFPYAPPVHVNMGYAPSCTLSCVGTAYAYITSGISPVQFSWNTGVTGTNTLINVCADSTYTVVVTDLCNTVDTGSVTIPVAPPLVATINLNNPSCPGSCNGSAFIDFNGGTPPLLYFWSNGTFSETAENLCNDSTYYCIVSDPGCSIDTFNILIPSYHLHDTAYSLQGSCASYCNGWGAVVSNGGYGPYNYLWSNGEASEEAFNLCPGINYCYISDQCGLLDTVSLFIDTLPLVHAHLAAQVNNTCYNGCAGTATISATSGIPPYTYAWSNGQFGATANNLCAGTYFVYVSDNTCSHDTVLVEILSPLIMSASMDSASTLVCRYDCNSTAQVFTTGAVPPFTYAWDNGVMTAINHTLCEGSHFVIVTDSGCSADTLHFTVPYQSDPHSMSLVLSNSTCFDSCNAVAQVLASGGQAPYTFQWNSGQTTALVNNLCAGIHIITVTDALGCVAHDTLLTHQPALLVFDTAIIHCHCFNADGSLSVLLSGGTPPYQIHWSTGDTLHTIHNLPPGVYSVSVSDSNACPYAASFTMDGVYPLLHISNDTTIILGNSVPLFVTGAATYLWSPPTGLSSDTATHPLWYGLNSASYCVIGIDTFGCADTACVDITVNDNCGDVDVPNAFSPNGDGSNDRFRLLAWCMDKVDFRVYDRWGQLVFETTDWKEGWDGNFNGQPAPVGVYVYYVDATNLRGKHFAKQGNVTLIR